MRLFGGSPGGDRRDSLSIAKIAQRPLNSGNIMKRSALRRSRRYRSIFRHNPKFRLLQATMLAALGSAPVGCTPAASGGGSDDAALSADVGTVSDMMTMAVDSAPTPETDAAPPVQDAAAPVVDAAPSVPDTALPPPDAAPPDPDAAQPVPDAAPPAPMGACENPQPVAAAGGAPSGIVQCADQSMNRVEPVQCQPVNVGQACPEGGNGHEHDQCLVDADCADRPNGRCLMVAGGGQLPACGCQYACETDNDCGDGMMCLCAGVTFNSSLCVPAGCLSNDDCDSGECAFIMGEGGCGVEAFSTCRQAEDACRSYAECDMEEAFEGCVRTGRGLACVGLPICGRPLMLAGESRMADDTVRSDWATELYPDVDGLSVDERLALTSWWRGIAALEHASVASFARFGLELMRYGAPADLLAQAQAGGADEVEHARLAYGLASAYADRPLGPGPLDLTGLQLSDSMADAVIDLVQEACLGESLGAAEARAMAEDATDPVVQRVCEKIAAEESRHAVLAWRALQWFLAQDASLVAVAEKALSEAVSAHLATPVSGREGIPGHGLLDAADRRALHEATIEAVVLPCALNLGMRVALA